MIIESPAGPIALRPETAADADFRYALFRASRREFEAIGLPPAVLEPLVRQQLQAQTLSYRAQFPRAHFDVIELAGERIGRIVVDRTDTLLHVVDIAIVPPMCGRGIGSAILSSLLAQAAGARQRVRLAVASDNEASLRLYERLGFVRVDASPAYLTLEWAPPPAQCS